jgi:hypothetical protein
MIDESGCSEVMLGQSYNLYISQNILLLGKQELETNLVILDREEAFITTRRYGPDKASLLYKKLDHMWST